YQLRRRLRLNTEVMRRDWDEDDHLWVLTLADGSTVTARFVVTALGAFVEPRVPDIAGLADFRGRVIQTQDWDDDFDATGKRIAIIGTGATAVQAVPKLAEKAATLDVYQRRAIWVFAKPDFPIPTAVQTLFHRLPVTQTVIRTAVAAAVELGLVGITVYGKQITPLAQIPALACRAYLFTQVRDRTLRRQLTPEYGFGCKRPSVSNSYYRTFTRDHVTLVTDPIERITETGIRTRDGVQRDIDVLVLATGFEMSNSPLVYQLRPVKGRDGFDLATFYESQRAAAYEGVSMPGLPNTFMVFGPYAWSGSSWHVMVENAARHTLRVITETLRRGATVAEISPEANDRFHRFVEQRGSQTLMHGRSCLNSNSYYIDKNGDFSFLRPTTAYQSTHASKNFDIDDYLYRS
ncbi:MAG TPA: NAD(P)/FAD-dependent oxidoreductase, partial [Mycobacterium sp.]|nr:NAD(P)/FAD-dependent oxidoreductase [Mycobacterium sp.]